MPYEHSKDGEVGVPLLHIAWWLIEATRYHTHYCRTDRPVHDVEGSTNEQCPFGGDLVGSPSSETKAITVLLQKSPYSGPKHQNI